MGRGFVGNTDELMLLLRIEAMGWKRLGVLTWMLGTVHGLAIALDMTAVHIWHSLSCTENNSQTSWKEACLGEEIILSVMDSF